MNTYNPITIPDNIKKWIEEESEKTPAILSGHNTSEVEAYEIGYTVGFEKGATATYALCMAERERWQKRCEAAEDYIKESPCDPDITQKQIEAYSKWQQLNQPK